VKRFSYSRLNLFQNCPRRFFYKYVLGWEDPAGLPAIFGKTVHKAIENYLNDCLFEEAIATAWITEADMSPAVIRAEIEQQVNTALSYSFTGEVEKHFVMELAEGIELQGYIDLSLEQGTFPRPAIVDWKTGRVTNEVVRVVPKQPAWKHAIKIRRLEYLTELCI